MKLYQTYKLKGLDKDSRTVYGAIASTGSIDRHGESLNPKGWKLDHFKDNPVILINHDYFGDPIGSATNVYERDGTLYIDFKIANTERGDEILQLIEDDCYNTLSVGFIPIKFDEKGDYTWAEMELIEVSIVTVPANAEALIKVKSFEDKYNTEKGTLEALQTMAKALKKDIDGEEPEVETEEEPETPEVEAPEVEVETPETPEEPTEPEVEETPEGEGPAEEDEPQEPEVEEEVETEEGEEETPEEEPETEKSIPVSEVKDLINDAIESALKKHGVIVEDVDLNGIDDEEMVYQIKTIHKHLKKSDKNVGIGLQKFKKLVDLLDK